MFPKGSNFHVGDYSAVVGTTTASLVAYTTGIASSVFPNADASYLITAYNNSTATAVMVTAQNKHLLFGPSSTDIWADLTSFNVAVTTSTTLGTVTDNLVQGWLLGSGGRLKISNVSTGSSDLNATVYFRVRKV